VLFVATIGVNFWHTRELVSLKQGGAKVAREITRGAQLYALEDDMHAAVIEAWLGKPLTRIKDPEELLDHADNGVLVIGPRGVGSAKSAQSSPSAKDYLRVLQKPESVKVRSLPYFGF